MKFESHSENSHSLYNEFINCNSHVNKLSELNDSNSHISLENNKKDQLIDEADSQFIQPIYKKLVLEKYLPDGMENADQNQSSYKLFKNYEEERYIDGDLWN